MAIVNCSCRCAPCICDSIFDLDDGEIVMTGREIMAQVAGDVWERGFIDLLPTLDVGQRGEIPPAGAFAGFLVHRIS